MKDAKPTADTSTDDYSKRRQRSHQQQQQVTATSQQPSRKANNNPLESLLSQLSQEDLEHAISGAGGGGAVRHSPHAFATFASLDVATTQHPSSSNANSRSTSPFPPPSLSASSSFSSTNQLQQQQQQQQQHRRDKPLMTIRSGRRLCGAHHRSKSSLSDLLVSLSGGIHTLAEDIVQQVQVVKGTFVDELQRGHRGKPFFLDMTMTRNLSVLPENITDFCHEAIGGRPWLSQPHRIQPRRHTTTIIDGRFILDHWKQQQTRTDVEILTEGSPLLSHPHFPKRPMKLTSYLGESDTVAATAITAQLQQDGQEEQDEASQHVAWFRYCSLLGAVLAVSSNGTALSLLDGVDPPLKLYWRMTATAAALFPFALRTMLVMVYDNNKTISNKGNYIRWDDDDDGETSIESCESAIDEKAGGQQSAASDSGTTFKQNNASSSGGCNSTATTSTLWGVPKLTFGQYVTFGLAVFCYSLNALLFVMALQYTSIANAVIYANSQALLLVLGKFFTGEPVVWMEGLGVVWAFCGAILCSKDSESATPMSTSTITTNTTLPAIPAVLPINGSSSDINTSLHAAVNLVLAGVNATSLLLNSSISNHTININTSTNISLDLYHVQYTNHSSSSPAQHAATTTMMHSYDHAYLGDLMACGSAAAGVAYMTFAKAIRPHVPVTVFMFMVMSLGSLLILLFMLAVNSRDHQGHNLTFSTDPFHGMFGWLSPEEDRLEIIVWMAIVCNVLGTMGFVRAMEYFDNLIIAVATLLEPMTAAFIAHAFGVGLLPGLLGWMGNIMVASGTFCVVYPSMNHHPSNKGGGSGDDGGH